MALIALKKDKDFLRVAIATNTRGTRRVQFDRALSVELAGETEELSPARLGDKLRAILEKVGVQRGDATVIVSRDDVEMQQLKLPPVPAEELPEMVRFLARNHFSEFSEDYLVDFIPIASHEDRTIVLATAISADVVQRIRDIVEPAGLKLKHIVVRPFAAAELVRAGYPSSKCRVILEIIGREADISVVNNDLILMTRTVRVPESYTVEKFDAWLPGEIRRTISAAQGQSGAPDVSEIVVCGSATEHEQLSADLKETFQIDTRFVQPFQLIQTTSRFEQPAKADGFASLMGSLIHSSPEQGRAIDFLNPRKKPESKVDRKKIFMIAGVVAFLAVAGALGVWLMIGSRDATIAELQNDIDEIRKLTQITDQTLKNTKPLDQWKSRQTNWLEELYRLSEILPDPDQTRLVSFGGSATRVTGSVNIRGLLKDYTMRSMIDSLESRPYSVEPDDDPTNNAGFDREYRVGLEFPYARVTPQGDVIPFYQDDSAKTQQDGGSKGTASPEEKAD